MVQIRVSQQCFIKNEGKSKEIKGQGMPFISYRIQTPKDHNGNYYNNQLCTYNFPSPQSEHVYQYSFSKDSPPSIEKSTTSNLRCLDSLQFEHHAESSGEPIICGDKIDDYKQIDGHCTISNITITFRSNEKVQKRGADFLILEYSAGVCQLVPLHA